jgi:undecaprenyl-diphosphatase
MNDACTPRIDVGFVTLGYSKVAILGVVQGITELLPISSTAHMRVLPALFGWQDPGSAFSAAMQIAALAAVVSYFWSDVRGHRQDQRFISGYLDFGSPSAASLQ